MQLLDPWCQFKTRSQQKWCCFFNFVNFSVKNYYFTTTNQPFQPANTFICFFALLLLLKHFGLFYLYQSVCNMRWVCTFLFQQIYVRFRFTYSASYENKIPILWRFDSAKVWFALLRFSNDWLFFFPKLYLFWFFQLL